MASKRRQEEQRKKEEEERLARVHQEFSESFSDGPKLDKHWVRAGTSESERKGTDSGKRELWRPTSSLADKVKQSFKTHHEREREPTDRLPPKPALKKTPKKSNLEKFKEELKVMQEERDERRRLKDHIRDCEEKGVAPSLLTSSGRPSRFEAPREALASLEAMETDIYGPTKGSAPDFGSDLTTTNVYLGNLNPKMSEQDICELFGKFGPLASIKIMWPRTEEEKSKGRHSGFVGFMTRADAEDAFDALKGKTIMDFEMRLSWGKAIPIPPRPVYIDKSMVKEVVPPPPSGLPFNAQPPEEDWEPYYDNYGNPDWLHDKTQLDQTDVQIVIPTERSLLCLIHRMVEYVVREGPLFEAMIMNRECKNPRFRFLFDNQTPAHCYYRWKLFSILQGDEPHVWSLRPFQMFKDGSHWIPPKMNPYMQKHLASNDRKGGPPHGRKVNLSSRNRDKLEDDLREITCDRVTIGKHAESADEIVEVITDSLMISETALDKKLARLSLISDLLHNSSVRLPNVSYFRKHFEACLIQIFESFHEVYAQIEGRLKAEAFKQKVMGVFRIWEEWVVYPIELLIRCQNIFLGLQNVLKIEEPVEEDVDGAPISPGEANGIGDADLDGDPIDSRRNSTDIDGAAIDEDVDGEPLESSSGKPSPPPETKKPKFQTSKWESVDDEVVKSQAVTTSKWEMVEGKTSKHKSSRRSKYDEGSDNGDSNLDGVPIDRDRSRSSSEESSSVVSNSMSGLSALSSAYTPKPRKSKHEDSTPSRLEMTESRRSKLRDIELKVMKYQDEVEAGIRSKKRHMSVPEQVQYYREKLMNKEREEAERDQETSHNRTEKKRKHSHSPSPIRRRKRSSSRGRKSRTSSPVSRRSRRSNSRGRSPSPRRRSRSRDRRVSRRSRSPRRKSRSRSRGRRSISGDRGSDRRKKSRY